MSACAGCGGPLPPSPRPRKWCSQRCRKASYGDPCVDCGARTCYGAEAARVPEPRCDPCSRERRREADHERFVRVVAMWGEGATRPEIAASMGMTVGSVGRLIGELRGRGYDLPRRRPTHLIDPALRARGLERAA